MQVLAYNFKTVQQTTWVSASDDYKIDLIPVNSALHQASSILTRKQRCFLKSFI